MKNKLNRRKIKKLYIDIKNSWRNLIVKNKIELTCMPHLFPHNPKYALNKIVMDFKNRPEIIKYGVLKI